MSTRVVDEHMFVVPVYGKPVWLDCCLESLRTQTIPSRLLITTSTPSAYLDEVARRSRVAIEVNPVCSGIGADWNFALSRASTPWVTLAHQDDWYAPAFLERCLNTAAHTPEATLVFTAAAETHGDTGESAPNARVKKLICDGVFLGAGAIRSMGRKRLLLSFGNPIPCSSVMLNRAAVPGFTFSEQLKSNLDWMAWLELAARPGAFVYIREPLVFRTVHSDAATVVSLEHRVAEDVSMLRRLWPRPIADVLARLYTRGLRQYATMNVRPR